MQEKIIYRRASREDASLVARVVSLALGEDVTQRYCGKNAIEVLETIARATDTQYSYINVIVAEINGSGVGAIIGYDGAMLQSLRSCTLDIIKQISGVCPYVEDETTAGEFYLDSIAVLPEWQGFGIGARLIELMRDEAFADGFNRVGLLVDFVNPRAEALYERLGFRRVNPTTLLGHKLWHMQAMKE